MFELLLAIDLGKNRRAQALGGNNTQPTNHAANANIDKHARLAIPWSGPKRSKNSTHDDQSGIDQKPRLDHKMLHALNVLHGGLLRSIHSNGDRSNDTTETAYLPNKAESFF
jgi:hypothetical protein